MTMELPFAFSTKLKFYVNGRKVRVTGLYLTPFSTELFENGTIMKLNGRIASLTFSADLAFVQEGKKVMLTHFSNE